MTTAGSCADELCLGHVPPRHLQEKERTGAPTADHPDRSQLIGPALARLFGVAISSVRIPRPGLVRHGFLKSWVKKAGSHPYHVSHGRWETFRIGAFCVGFETRTNPSVWGRRSARVNRAVTPRPPPSPPPLLLLFCFLFRFPSAVCPSSRVGREAVKCLRQSKHGSWPCETSPTV